MQKTRPDAGFTMIELLVVIAILGLLIATFLPDIFGAKIKARQAADAANLRWHYQTLTGYEMKYKKLPPYTGHKFVLAAWASGDVQRTEENFNRYWLPETQDLRRSELAELDPETIWRNLDETTSQDTHYAGPGAEMLRGFRMGNGKLPLMADDNEGAPAWEDFSINVLLGSGDVRLLTSMDLQEHGFDPDQQDAPPYEVGPESSHPLLQKLER